MDFELHKECEIFKMLKSFLCLQTHVIDVFKNKLFKQTHNTPLQFQTMFYIQNNFIGRLFNKLLTFFTFICFHFH